MGAPINNSVQESRDFLTQFNAGDYTNHLHYLTSAGKPNNTNMLGTIVDRLSRIPFCTFIRSPLKSRADLTKAIPEVKKHMVVLARHEIGAPNEADVATLTLSEAQVNALVTQANMKDTYRVDLNTMRQAEREAVLKTTNDKPPVDDAQKAATPPADTDVMQAQRRPETQTETPKKPKTERRSEAKRLADEAEAWKAAEKKRIEKAASLKAQKN